MRVNEISVLVADDDEGLRTLLRYSLGADPRFRLVGEAYDGRSTMRAIEAEHPDAVILDLDMPNMDGRYALAQIRMSNPDTKIVVHTGTQSETDIALMYEGAHAVMRKDGNTYDLADTVYQAVAASNF